MAAGRTNDLLKIALNELALQLDGSQLMCGDMNVNTCDLPCLHALLEAGELHDLGDTQQLTGKEVPE